MIWGVWSVVLKWLVGYFMYWKGFRCYCGANLGSIMVGISWLELWICDSGQLCCNKNFFVIDILVTWWFGVCGVWCSLKWLVNILCTERDLVVLVLIRGSILVVISCLRLRVVVLDTCVLQYGNFVIDILVTWWFWVCCDLIVSGVNLGSILLAISWLET